MRERSPSIGLFKAGILVTSRLHVARSSPGISRKKSGPSSWTSPQPSGRLQSMWPWMSAAATPQVLEPAGPACVRDEQIIWESCWLKERPSQLIRELFVIKRVQGRGRLVLGYYLSRNRISLLPVLCLLSPCQPREGTQLLSLDSSKPWRDRRELNSNTMK